MPAGVRKVQVDVTFDDTGELFSGDGGTDAVGDSFSLVLTPP